MAYPEIGITNGWFFKYDEDDETEVVRIMNYFYNRKDKYSMWHYSCFRHWHERRTEILCDKFPIKPRPSLPSTLADIRARKENYYTQVSNGPFVIHNEGNELTSLKENIHLFQKWRLSLEVACYHSRDGLWKIPKFLMDNLKNYRFTFRKR